MAGVAQMGRQPMLLDAFLPAYHFNEVHTTTIRAAPDRVYRAIHEVTVSEMPFVSLLFSIRTLPARLRSQRTARYTTQPLLTQMLASGFVLLADEPGRELVVGTIGKFWELAGSSSPRIADMQAFRAFEEPGYAKAVMNFRLEPRSAGTSVRTETRIAVADPLARKKFATYWRVISFGSAFMRRMWLRAIKLRTERSG
jgi:hypothetical protein